MVSFSLGRSNLMKKIAVTMGEPGGVGPEIIVKTIASQEVRNLCIPFVIGDLAVMEAALKITAVDAKLKVIQSPEEAAPGNGIDILHTPGLKDFVRRRSTPDGGMASAVYIRKAVELALAKDVDAVITAPISKESLKKAGFDWPGHTEMIAELTKTKDYAMMLAGGPLRVILTTIHTALRNVPDLIKRETVLKTIRLAEKACRMLEIDSPRIAVAGLNPHAGEAGIFGTEEVREIIPAVNDAVSEGIQVTGPFPPDIVFRKAYLGEFDIVVCMYHDQGLIPLKMIAFETGVNVTVGLPIIRTSPDHGTAYDIAWTGKANPSSMIEAVKLALKMKIA
jgi:4-hydroxythreonine-4-phosphate dehydrogenase